LATPDFEIVVAVTVYRLPPFGSGIYKLP